jgi:hypothetical protein
MTQERRKREGVGAWGRREANVRFSKVGGEHQLDKNAMLELLLLELMSHFATVRS